MGERHAVFSSRAGNNDAEDQGCDPGEHRPCVDGGGTLRVLGTNRLEMAQRDRVHGLSHGTA